MPIGVAKTEQKGNRMGEKKSQGVKYGKSMGKKCDQSSMRHRREKGKKYEGGGD